MDILKLYQNRVKQSRDFAEPYWDKMVDNYKHYLARLLETGNANPQNYPFYSQMSIPISFDIIETLMPRVIGKDPEFLVVAIDPSDEPSEPVVKTVIEMEYNNPKLDILGEPIYAKLIDLVKETLIAGTGVARVFWRREKVKQYKYVASIEKLGIENVDYSEFIKKYAKLKDKAKIFRTTFDAPFLDDFDMRVVPFFMFLPDPAFPYPGKMRYMIEFEWRTLEEILDEAERFEYDKTQVKELVKLVEERRDGFTPELNKEFIYKYSQLFHTTLNQSTVFSTDDDKIPLFLVAKMWEGDRVHVIVNDKYVLTGEKGMRNPYYVFRPPFVFSKNIPLPNSFYGKSEIDFVGKLEEAITDLWNMRYDNLLQSMLNYWLVNPNFLAEGEEFEPIPNSITAVSDVDRAVRVISGKDVTAAAYKEAAELLALINRVVGLNDVVRGDTLGTLARTYGGVRLIQEASNARLMMKARMFEQTTLKSLGYFILELARQYITKKRVMRMVGKYNEVVVKEVDPDKLRSIKGFMDIRVIPNSTMMVDQQTEAIRMKGVMQDFMTEKGPFSNMPPSVWDRLLARYLRANGIHDAAYWVSEIRKAREEREKEVQVEEKKAGKQQKRAEQTPIATLPVNTEPVVQSDQIAEQPSPAELLSVLGGGLPVETQ